MKWQLTAIAAALVLSAGCGGPAGVSADAPAETENAAAENAAEPVRPGMGKKRRDLSPGPVATNIEALFSVKERLALERIPHALELYRATNGEYPKTHDEFMKEIIEANGIELPKLPEGHKYVYDPDTHQLLHKHQ